MRFGYLFLLVCRIGDEKSVEKVKSSFSCLFFDYLTSFIPLFADSVPKYAIVNLIYRIPSRPPFFRAILSRS